MSDDKQRSHIANKSKWTGDGRFAVILVSMYRVKHVFNVGLEIYKGITKNDILKLWGDKMTKLYMQCSQVGGHFCGHLGEHSSNQALFRILARHGLR